MIIHSFYVTFLPILLFFFVSFVIFVADSCCAAKKFRGILNHEKQ